MVEYLNSQNPASFCQLLLNLQIAVAGFKRTGRMVMGKDHGGGSIRDHVSKDLARMHLTPIQQPHCHGSILDNFISAVKSDTNKIFLLLVRYPAN